MQHVRFFLLGLFLTIPAISMAGDTLTLRLSQAHPSIADLPLSWIESSEPLNLETARPLWQQGEKDFSQLSMPWLYLRLRVQNSDSLAARWLWLLDAWDEVEVLAGGASTGMQSRILGHQHPFGIQPFELYYPYVTHQRLGFRNYLLLELAPGEQAREIVLQIHQTSAMPLGMPLELITEGEARSRAQQFRTKQLLQFLFLGMLALLFLHQLTLFTVRYDRVHLIYALYSLCVMLITLDYSGVLARVFFNGQIASLDYAKFMTDMALIMAYIWFYQALFPNTPRWSLRLKWMQYILAAIALAGTLYFLLYRPVFTLVVAAFVISALPVLVFLPMFVQRWQQEGKLFRYFIWGTLTLITGHLINGGLYVWGKNEVFLLGYLDRFNILQLGFLFELLWFLRSLGYRNYLVQKQNFELRTYRELSARFFGRIGQQIQMPLSLIAGPVYRLRQLALEPEASMLVGWIEHYSQQLLLQTRQLLAFSRLDAGQMQLNVKPLKAVSFFRDRSLAFAAQALNQQINFETDFPEAAQERELYADPHKLEQIIDNLLSNAFRYTPAGGTVGVRLWFTSAELVFAVTDTGEGIPPAMANHIFEPYSRFTNGFDNRFTVVGLGLAIVREFVQLHKGKIRVESKAQKGTTFEVRLKLGKAHLSSWDIARASLAARPAPSSQTPAAGENKAPAKARVLIVEPNPDMRNLLRMILSDHFQLSEAINFNQGWRMLQQSLPDLVICDSLHPARHGFRLCAQLKADTHTHHIPLILLADSGEHAPEHLHPRADLVLRHPLDPKEVRTQAAALIENRRLLQSYYQAQRELPAENIDIDSSDHQFLQKVKKKMELHYKDSKFGVKELASSLGVSRKHLHAKLNSLLHHSPTDVMRDFRLEKALQLLKGKYGNISEVAFATGFNSASYFSKAFKERYGMTPTDFRKNTGQ